MFFLIAQNEYLLLKISESEIDYKSERGTVSCTPARLNAVVARPLVVVLYSRHRKGKRLSFRWWRK